MFLVVWFVGLVFFRDGRWVSDGSVWESVLLVLMYAALMAAPLASLVLSSMAFRRTHSLRDLAPALTLLALVSGFAAMGLAQPGVRADPNFNVWTFLTAPLGIAAWIRVVVAWPRRTG